MGAVFKRELKSYFTSPLGYIVTIIYLLMGGAFFGYMYSSGIAQIEGIFSYMSNFSYFLIPVLTMRSFSEERRAKTDQALFTAPIKISSIVLGKFFAALSIIGAINCITFIYQFIFAVNVNVNWVIFLSCYIGAILFSAALVALGLFISSLTENQMVAAMGSVAAALLLMMTDTLAALVSSIKFLYNALTWMSFSTRFNTFINGLFSYADVAFFISFAAIFLFLTVRIIERRRWAGGSKEQSYALVALITAVGAVVFGWSAVKQFIANGKTAGTSAFTYAVIFTLLAALSSAGLVWSIIKFLRILSSRKKGAVVVSFNQKGEWRCPVCGTHNIDMNNYCIRCDVQRATSKAQAEAYKSKKLSKKRSVKHSAYAMALTAVFVAAIVGLNVAASALSDAYPLTLDLTTNKDYSISKENLKYIEKISRDVTITVCADEDEYSSGTYANLVASTGIYDMSEGMFYLQTEKLLKEYAMRSDKITLQYIDPQSTDFSGYASKYDNEDFSTGDILIECEFKLDGKNVEHYRHLSIDDIYGLEDTSQNQNLYALYYSGYTHAITKSNVETAVTSAIYAVTADKTFEVALITANDGKKVDALQKMMEVNNYSFTEINNLITNDIPEDTDLVIIAAPTLDYSEAELQKLDKFLDVDGKLGKNILYIPDATIQGKNVPNLTAFIAEWGFTVQDGIALGTDSNTYTMSEDNLPTAIFGTKGDSEYLSALGSKDYLYLADYYTAISVAFEEDESRKTEVLVSLPESAVCVPIDATSAEDIKTKGPFAAIGVASDVGYDEDKNASYSRVMVVGGLEIIESRYNSISQIGNLNAILSAINYIFEVDDIGITFDARTLSTATFNVTNANSSTFMYIIFVGIIPLAVLVACVIMYVRRRHL